MKELLIKFWKDEEGATAIEYGLIAGLIVVAIMATVALIGGQLDELFVKINGVLTTANGAG